MSEYQSRPAVECAVPLNEAVTALKIESVILRLGDYARCDIGALCFKRRASSRTRVGGSTLKPRLVDLVSFDAGRAVQIRRMVSYLSDVAKTSGNRFSTISEITRNIIRFIDWCDQNGHSRVLETEAETRMGLRAYVSFLRERLRKNEASSGTLSTYHKSVIPALNHHHGTENIDAGINTRWPSTYSEGTPPPDELVAAKVLSLSRSLFYGVCDLVLEGLPYPFKISLSYSSTKRSGDLWIFPSVRWCMPEHEQAVRSQLRLPHWAYDYANGCLAAKVDIVGKYGVPASATVALKAARSLLARANSNNRHSSRVQRAMMGQFAFLFMFVANTGMNLAQACNLPWKDEYEINAERQGFRTIKYRAENKTVAFDIEIGFLRMFTRYVELRRYLLNGIECKMLFFNFGIQNRSKPKRHNLNQLISHHRLLKKIDPDIPSVTAREWRAKKSDWAVRNTDLSTAAKILNTSEQSMIRHYTAGSPTVAIEEMTSLFESVSESVSKSVVTQSRRRDPTWVENEIGGCKSFERPQRQNGDIHIDPDCRKVEGCLFCAMYVAHADERDARKLLSCMHCIQRTSHLVSKEEFDGYFNPVIDRIEMILSTIAAKAKDGIGLVERVRSEVEQGELDQYWERKMLVLIELGIVAS